MKPKRIIAIIVRSFALALLVWGLSLCILIAVPHLSSVSIPRPVWLSDLLEKPVCTPPCWQNITPGVSTQNDVISSFYYYPEVIYITKSFEEVFQADFLRWHFRDDLGWGESKLDEEGKVANISLGIPHDHTFTLQEFEQAFGEFSHVDFLGCRGEFNFQDCYIGLIILEKGISAEVTIDVRPGKHERANIKPDAKIDDINFFIPGFDGYEEFYYRPWHSNLVPWQGYGKYDVPEGV